MEHRTDGLKANHSALMEIYPLLHSSIRELLDNLGLLPVDGQRKNGQLAHRPNNNFLISSLELVLTIQNAEHSYVSLFKMAGGQKF
jgi:hypothetical protein